MKTKLNDSVLEVIEKEGSITRKIYYVLLPNNLSFVEKKFLSILQVKEHIHIIEKKKYLWVRTTCFNNGGSTTVSFSVDCRSLLKPSKRAIKYGLKGLSKNNCKIVNGIVCKSELTGIEIPNDEYIKKLIDAYDIDNRGNYIFTWRYSSDFKTIGDIAYSYFNYLKQGDLRSIL